MLRLYERHRTCNTLSKCRLGAGEGPTQAASLDGFQLEFEDRGNGEPVVFIHGSILANVFDPILADPHLAGRFRLISYHRRGFAGSSHPNRPISIAEQAQDCRKLLEKLNVESAHVVGYSYGATIALQLALDAPQVVFSLALLEAALLAVPSGPRFAAAMRPVVELHASGEKAGAIDAFLRLMYGPGYRTWLDRVLPGAFDKAVADADTFFCQEWPAIQQWCFTDTKARSLHQASLAVLGAKSASNASMFPEGHELLSAWLPHVERFELANSSHGLQLQNPAGMAAGLAAFLSRHRMPDHTMAKTARGERLRMRR